MLYGIAILTFFLLFKKSGQSRNESVAHFWNLKFYTTILIVLNVSSFFLICFKKRWQHYSKLTWNVKKQTCILQLFFINYNPPSQKKYDTLFTISLISSFMSEWIHGIQFNLMTNKYYVTQWYRQRSRFWITFYRLKITIESVALTYLYNCAL